MKTILDGTSRRVGAIFNEIDTNFIEVCNSLVKIAYPDKTLQGYAETEPAVPVTGDCYLVLETATVWEIAAEKNDILHFNGADWELLPFKITEINEALQFFYFDADKINLQPVEGLAAFNVQQAIEEITAALVLNGIIIPDGSGSGSGSGSV